MNSLEITLIALSLSMDAFAISISSGGTMKFFKISDWLKMAFFFGFFHAIMPAAGWMAGISLLKYIANFDHWVVFFILSVIGAKMIYEGYYLKDMNCTKKGYCLFSTTTLAILAMAVSTDALAVGITLSMMKISIITPVIIMGAVTFLMSLAGIRIGYMGKNFFESKIEILAGLVLILLAFKILIQHTLEI